MAILKRIGTAGAPMFGTLAQRPASAFGPQLYFVTDVGMAGFWSFWDVAASRWRAVGNEFILYSLNAPVLHGGGTGVTERLANAVIPAGLIAAGDQMEVVSAVHVSTLANSVPTQKLRLGTAGTTSDAEINSTSLPSTTGMHGGFSAPYVFESLTAIRLLQALGASAQIASGATASAPVTIPNLASNALNLGLFYTNNDTTGGPETHNPTCRLFQVKIRTVGA